MERIDIAFPPVPDYGSFYIALVRGPASGGRFAFERHIAGVRRGGFTAVRGLRG